MSSESDAMAAADGGARGGEVGDTGKDDGEARLMFDVKQLYSFTLYIAFRFVIPSSAM